MRPVGRPLSFDDLKAKRIVDAIARGNSRRCAAKLGGVDFSTLMRWLSLGEQGDERFRDFYNRVSRADGEVEDRMVSRVIEAADSGNWVAAKTWLELRKSAWRPRKPKEPMQQDLSGKSEEELVAAVEKWMAERKVKVG